MSAGQGEGLRRELQFQWPAGKVTTGRESDSAFPDCRRFQQQPRTTCEVKQSELRPILKSSGKSEATLDSA